LSVEGFVGVGAIIGVVGEKRLYFSPRASSDALKFLANVDVAVEYSDRDNCSLFGLSSFFV